MDARLLASLSMGPLPIRSLRASPNGQYLVVWQGEGRTSHSNWTRGAILLRRCTEGFVHAGALPADADTFALMVCDDGRCFVVKATHSQVHVTRCGLAGGQVLAEAPVLLVSYNSLLDVACEMLPTGDAALFSAVDRDDGHGWSDPIYTDLWYQLDLRAGADIKGVSLTSAGRPHMLRAPGAPWLSPFHCDTAGLLLERTNGLPRPEKALRVGPTRLLTRLRVIDIVSGRTLAGEGNPPLRTFHDMSPDERLALSTHAQGAIELWDAEAGTMTTLLQPDGSEARCGCFLPGGNIAVGTSRGEVLLFG